MFLKKKSYLFSPDKNLKTILKNILGFVPRDLRLYQLALVHKSVSALKFKDITINNERLEYLGDSVLNTIVSEYLYNYFTEKDEGFLTQMRSKIVNREFLNNIAIKLGIPNILQAKINNEYRKYIYGDALEALVGALFLNKGYEKTKQIIIERIIKNHINIEKLKNVEIDFKSKILEWGQKNKKNIIFTSYEEEKDNNSNTFIAQLLISDEIYGRGMGHSKKEAEQMAAKQALQKLGII